MFVDFVGDGQNIPLLAKVSDQLKFLAAEDLSGRIVRRINNDGLRLVVEGRREFVFVEGPVRLAELHVARRGAGDNRVGPVVFVERLEYDDLVARIDDGQQHVDHRFGGTTRNGDLALRIDVEIHELLRFVHQRIAEAFCAPRYGVLIDIRENRVGRRLLQHFGSSEVWESLRQIDRLMFEGQTRHLANDRFGKLACLVRNRFVEHL